MRHLCGEGAAQAQGRVARPAARQASGPGRVAGDCSARSAALDSSPEYGRRRGALLHTPGPAPPSARFSSLKAPANTGRSRFPARPRLPPPTPVGWHTSPGSGGGSAGAPQTSERGGRLEIRGEGRRPSLRAKREAEAMGVQISVPDSSLPNFFPSLSAESWESGGGERAHCIFLSREGKNWTRVGRVYLLWGGK